MINFTPGPWNTFKYPDVKSWTVAAKESIASKIKTEQDANLISAAPEMLEALEMLQKYYGSNDNEGLIMWRKGLSLADSVIKKARGES